VLGNEAVGRHPVEEIEAVTDKLGNARFVVEAGSHPEDVSLYVLVEENPVNPWFKPSSWSPPRFFYPGNKSDDSPQGRAVYHFRVNVLLLDATSGFSKELAEQFQAGAVQRQSLVNPRTRKKPSRKLSQVPPPDMELPILPIKPRP